MSFSIYSDTFTLTPNQVVNVDVSAKYILIVPISSNMVNNPTSLSLGLNDFNTIWAGGVITKLAPTTPNSLYNIKLTNPLTANIEVQVIQSDSDINFFT